jgi:hypothetical protein
MELSQENRISNLGAACPSRLSKSHIHIDKDRLLIEIRALEWARGQIQDLILKNVTRDWRVYNKYIDRQTDK